MARGGLLDVHRDERRSAVARPIRDLDVEPELRGPAGQGRPDVPRVAADRRGLGHRRGRRRSAAPAADRAARPGRRTLVAEPFSTFSAGSGISLLVNVDTDQIVPARYLKVTDKA